MIVGVTHDFSGRAALRLAVSTKVAIGMPPQGDRNYPSKLDHFVFLRKKKTAKGLEWEPDPDLMKHYGGDCKGFEIMLIDDDIDNVFPSSYAWWTASERKCWGDGTQATRRTPEHPAGARWTPCGGQCAELVSGLCKPSGDLRFVLAEFPRLGSVCRIHTTSYRSIRQIHSALEEIQTFTGGRLAGITAKLVVRAEQTTYYDRKEQRKKATTIWALSLEVDGDDIRTLVAHLTGSARLFAQTRKLLGWGERAIEVVEDEEEQAPEITSEFYPPSEQACENGTSPDGSNAQAQPSFHSAGRNVSQGSPVAGPNAATKRPSKPPIMEPKRRPDPGQSETKNASGVTSGSVNGVRGSAPIEDARARQSASVAGPSLQGPVENGSNGLAAETTCGYDGNGNLTSLKEYVTPSSTISRSFGYGSYGVLQTATDFAGNPTTFTNNGCNGSFPTQVNQPLSLSGTMAWDCNTGMVTSVTDPNGQPTSFVYDELDRVTNTNYPDGGGTSTTYTDGPSGSVQTLTKLTSSQNRQDTALLDGLGRITETQLNDPPCVDKVDTTYDSLGRVASVSNPYRSTSESTYGVTTYTYDALGRQTGLTHPDSNATHTWYGAAVTANGGRSSTLCNAQNRNYPALFSDEDGKLRQT